MDVGLQMVFASYGWTNVPDGEVWDEELRLARLAGIDPTPRSLLGVPARAGRLLARRDPR